MNSAFQGQRPIVLVSKCLGFAACRYNSQTIPDAFVDSLKRHVEFRPLCPEVEVGLGVPRNPIRIVMQDGKRLVQPATGSDLTERMVACVDQLLSGFDADGAILKFGSPSCGIGGVKVYSGFNPDSRPSRGTGFFGGEGVRRFPFWAVEDEGRLTNFSIRERFLTRLFMNARFRLVQDNDSLVRFHTRHKYLFMAYSQAALRSLGRIVAASEEFPWKREHYLGQLGQCMAKAPKEGALINVAMRQLGHLRGLSAAERKQFLDTLELYRDERIPFSVVQYLLKSWAVRFQNSYLLDQIFLEPYPLDLVQITDSGKGRDN